MGRVLAQTKSMRNAPAIDDVSHEVSKHEHAKDYPASPVQVFTVNELIRGWKG